MTWNKTRKTLTALALLGAATAGATCTDTMVLRSFTRADKHFRLLAKGAIDSSVVTTATFNGSTELAQAMPLTMPTVFAAKDSLLLPLRFAANCGSDSVSSVALWRGVDSAGKDKMQLDVRVNSGREVRENLKAMAVGGTNFSLKNGTLSFASYWPIEPLNNVNSPYYFGVLNGTSSLVGAMMQTRSVAYKGGVVKNMSSYPMSSVLPGAIGMAEEQAAQIDAFKTAWSAKLDDGTYDSVAITHRSFDLKYDFATVGIAGRSSRKHASVQTTAQGWLLSSDVAAVGVVRSLDGRLLRQYPASQSFLWDGRAQGQPVARGLYLVGFEGQGLQRVIAP